MGKRKNKGKVSLKDLSDFENWTGEKKARLLKRYPEGVPALRIQLKIRELVSNGEIRDTIQWFKQHQAADLKVGHYCSILRAISECGDELKEDFELILDSVTHLPKLNEGVYSLAIRTYSNWSMYKSALQWLDKMKKSTFKPKLRTYVPIIESVFQYCSLEELDTVHNVYDEYRECLKDKDFTCPLHCYASMLTGVIRLRHLSVSISDMKAEQVVVFLFNKVLCHLSSENLIPDKNVQDLIVKWFEKENYVIERGVRIPKSGVCPVTKVQLHQKRMDRRSKESLANKIESLVTSQKSLKNDWEIFKGWMQTREAKLGKASEVDVVIDAANVAYFKQNRYGGGFRFQSIQEVTSKLRALGLSFLIVLHKSHTTKRDCSKDEDKALLQRWRKNLQIVIVESRHNDDWYWLYCAVSQNKDAMVLSNDEMRDHHFMMLRQMIFRTWKRNHQIKFDIVTNKSNPLGEFKLVFPNKYAVDTQLVCESSSSQIIEHNFGKYAENRDNNKILFIAGNYEPRADMKFVNIHIPQADKGESLELRAGHVGKYTAKSPALDTLTWTCIYTKGQPSV